MNPNAKPFSPTAAVTNASHIPVVKTPTPSEKKTDSDKGRERRRRRRRLSSATAQEPKRELHSNILINRQKKAEKEMRRRRRGNCKRKNLSTTAKSTDIIKDSIDAYVNQNPFERNQGDKKKEMKNKSTSAAGSDSLETQEIGQEINARPDLDLSVSFPMLSLASATVKNAESFWDDCQKNEALVTASTKTSDKTFSVESCEDNDNTSEHDVLNNNADVPLVKLKSNKLPSFIAEKNIHKSSEKEDPEKPEKGAMNSPVDTETDNIYQMPSLPNVRLKWNEAQMSRMRNRLWEAERVKRQKNETRKKKAGISSHQTDSDESSSTSSSESIFSPGNECDDAMEPPLLNIPFDERITKQPNVPSLSEKPIPATAHHTVHISQETIKLEQQCRESTHPLHFIIHHYYTVKTSAHSLSVADSVLRRLLRTQSLQLEQWLSTRISLYDLFDQDLDSHVMSADIYALNPLQLCIILNLHHVIRTILSTPCQASDAGLNNVKHMEEDNIGRTPLMLACELHRSECIEVLLTLTNKPKLDHREKEHGNSAFHFCCMGTKIIPTDDDCDAAAANTLELLLSRTPHSLQRRMLFAVNNQRKSLLHLACASGDLQLVDCILNELGSRGSNLVTKALNMKDIHHCVPFITAVMADAKDIAMHLLVSRMNTVHLSTFFDGCPITIASLNRSVEMVRMLLEAGGYTSYDINRALLGAVQSNINISNNIDDGDTEKRCEIMSILIACGANPYSKISTTQYPQSHLIKDDTVIASRSLRQQSRPSVSPLTEAACSGDIEGVRTMMSSYSLVLPSQRSSRRNDPLLRLQSDSYFEAIEKREDDVIDSSIQTTLVECLFQYYMNGDINSAKIALLIYRRGVGLSQKSVQWLMTALKTRKVMSVDDIYACMHAPTIIFQVTSPNVSDDDTNFQLKWSKVFLSLNLLPSKKILCPYLRGSLIDQSSYDDGDGPCISLKDEDEFYLVVGERKILAHKSIVSSKSGKLAANIRFSEAQLMDSNAPLFVRIDLPLPVAKMLLSHIYHGSIVFGLKSGSPSLQCTQLLDLVLLAEEYLCPTLILECEMRLLGSGQCVCRNCLIDHRRLRETECCSSVYEYVIDASCTGVITAETALDVIAVAKQLEQSSAAHQCYYKTKQVYCNSSPATTKSIPGPFIAAKMTAISLCLKSFKDVINSASFAQHTSMSSEEETMSCSQANCDKDAIMLLLMCLEEAVQWCNTSECSFTFPMEFSKFLP